MSSDYGSLVIDENKTELITAGDKVPFKYETPHTSRTNELPFLYNYSGTTQKFTNWYQTNIDYNLSLQFTANNLSPLVKDANFNSTAPVTVKNYFLESSGLNPTTDNIYLKDPWYFYKDNNNNWFQTNQHYQYPSPFEVQNNSSTSYGGVFLNQGYDPQTQTWTQPYYSVKVDAVQDVTLNTTGVPSGRTHKFYFQNWSGTNTTFQDAYNTETPVVFTSEGATAQANLKGTQLTTHSFSPPQIGQRGFIKDSNLGYLHNVYESMGDLWYERSTDNGVTWVIMNNGKPINDNYNYSGAESPSICFNSELNLIYIVYQTVGESFPNYGIVLTQFKLAANIVTPNWSATIWDANYSESNSYAPVVASMGSAGIILIDTPSSDAVGIRAFNFTTGEYPNYNFISSSEFTIPEVNSASYHPSIASGYQRYHLVYEQSQTSIKYYAWGSMATTSFTVSTGSSDIFNISPVISLLNGGIPIVSWIGGTYNYQGGITPQVISTRVATTNLADQWGTIKKAGGQIQSISNSSNTSLPRSTLITWSALSSGTNIISKWMERVGTTYTIPSSLLPYGNYIQAASDINFSEPKALVFKNSTPSYFILSSTNFAPGNSTEGGISWNGDGNVSLGKITEEDTIVTFGRSGVAVINDIEFAFEIGDILVGDSIINFIQVPDTIVYTSDNDLSQHTRTENFSLTPETQFYFTDIYQVVQKANPDSALSETDAVNFKAELINAITDQVVGTFDNVTYNKNNLLKHKNIDYLVDCSGITPGEYYLRLVTTVTGNAEYVMADIVNDYTTLAKKNFNNISFKGTEIPETYALEQNFPNPFNPSTTIRYQIPKDGLVTLKIYDILGAEVATLVNEEKAAGKYEVNFNAASVSQRIASGVYIYTIKSNEFTASKKLLLLK